MSYLMFDGNQSKVPIKENMVKRVESPKLLRSGNPDILHEMIPSERKGSFYVLRETFRKERRRYQCSETWPKNYFVACLL